MNNLQETNENYGYVKLDVTNTDELKEKLFYNVNNVKDAIFKIINTKSGMSFIYKISKINNTAPYFINILLDSGIYNNKVHFYLGSVNIGLSIFKHSEKSIYKKDSMEVIVFNYFLSIINGINKPNTEIYLLN